MLRTPRFATAALLVLLSLAAAPHADARRQSTIDYTLRMTRPETHLFEVAITAEQGAGAWVDFQMPAWSPGRYVIYDFARNVQEVAARDASGRRLRVNKVDKQTWRVPTAGASGRITFSYKVFANDLSGTFSQLDARHASLNGASVFMYVVGRKPNPVRLTVEPPANWRIANGLSTAPRQTVFEAPNYDILIDTPTEVAPDFDLRTFEIDGREYRVMVHQLGDERSRTERYVADVRRIVSATLAVMGPPDLERYTFLVHFDPDSEAGDGMEHLTSTSIVRAFELDEDEGYDSLLNVTAHEFFHVWNVKRLRPAGLGPWDYTRETYTTSLWIAEGVTSYYADLLLARAGLWREERFFKALAEQITVLENTPGRRLMSLEQSSFDTWFYVSTRPRQRSNTSDIAINYYNKGHVVGFLLDLEIRRRTNNARSLDDVFRLLYRRFYVDAPAESYYLKGRGYRGADFLGAVNEVSGSDFGAFFARYVSGVDEIDYDEILGVAGLRVVRRRSTFYEVEPRRDATPAQVALRRAWLGTGGA
jgi:predicted metalloprotease with PDZ domain